MTSQERLQRDIEILKESIALSLAEIRATPPTLSKKELAEIRDSIAWCTEELRSLLAQIDQLI